MAIRYLLDTNIASFAIKDSMSDLRRRLRRFSLERSAISVITEAELRCGLALSPEATRLKLFVEEFLRRIEILSWTSGAAFHYAHERASLEKAGQMMDDIDMMIAAHALAENAILVTNDAAFRRIKHLKIEDWTRP
ncbi:type II toxin-antitoxin system VapC family toxin [Alloacidobacterium sp.]|uniref:type II toxin-antitoxin system VapC family toxin n=1 Tax=Alloacidobacterium sp. TaxID=2951999 RepID=UPI002D3FBF26|nr:type II toxin-antitoxin system VapC family toxin [Alloacidobacterium sp.]HYK34913.1 type II toxin-antitoxin system VapC family toxin [Alloacidobacterium sp.]